MADETTKVSPTAQEIIEHGRRRRIKEVPYLGGVVYAYGMTRAESKAYRAECTESSGGSGPDEYADERLLLHMIRDGAGRRIFGEGHLTQLADMNEADWNILFEACAEVNGWSRLAQQLLEKNSRTRTGGSGCDSPPPLVSASGSTT